MPLHHFIYIYTQRYLSTQTICMDVLKLCLAVDSVRLYWLSAHLYCLSDCLDGLSGIVDCVFRCLYFCSVIQVVRLDVYTICQFWRIVGESSEVTNSANLEFLDCVILVFLGFLEKVFGNSDFQGLRNVSKNMGLKGSFTFHFDIHLNFKILKFLPRNFQKQITSLIFEI